MRLTLSLAGCLHASTEDDGSQRATRSCRSKAAQSQSVSRESTMEMQLRKTFSQFGVYLSCFECASRFLRRRLGFFRAFLSSLSCCRSIAPCRASCCSLSVSPSVRSLLLAPTRCSQWPMRRSSQCSQTLSSTIASRRGCVIVRWSAWLTARCVCVCVCVCRLGQCGNQVGSSFFQQLSQQLMRPAGATDAIASTPARGGQQAQQHSQQLEPTPPAHFSSFQRGIASRFFRAPRPRRGGGGGDPSPASAAGSVDSAPLPVARAVLIDMEPKVIQQALKHADSSGSFAYDHKRTFYRQSGSGNNCQCARMCAQRG